ncbi:MAG: DUF433 domain-containing protein [Candidatus Hodarchaeales archaeon]
MTWEISVDPEILGGKPIIKGTRIPVDLIFELAGLGYSVEQIIREYPHLAPETVKGVLQLGQLAIENLARSRSVPLNAEEGAT